MQNDQLRQAARDFFNIAFLQNQDNKPVEEKKMKPRMRTLPAAIRELQADDPGCAFTLAALRRFVKQGRIPCVHVASKTLVDLNDLYGFLSKGG